jgi:hypothetical protein
VKVTRKLDEPDVTIWNRIFLKYIYFALLISTNSLGLLSRMLVKINQKSGARLQGGDLHFMPTNKNTLNMLLVYSSEYTGHMFRGKSLCWSEHSTKSLKYTEKNN